MLAMSVVVSPESPCSRTTSAPSTPPAALMSSTASSAPKISAGPRKARSPVTGKMVPMVRTPSPSAMASPSSSSIASSSSSMASSDSSSSSSMASSDSSSSVASSSEVAPASVSSASSSSLPQAAATRLNAISKASSFASQFLPIVDASPLIERFNASEPGQSRHSDWLDLSQAATVAEERGQGGAFGRVHTFATEAKQGDSLDLSHFGVSDVTARPGWFDDRARRATGRSRRRTP